MFKKLRAPIGVQWEVTPQCNFNCIHCYNFWKQDLDSLKSRIDYSLWSKIIREVIDNKIFSVIITGGEPLLVIDSLYPYIDNLIKGGVNVSINSNVSLLTSEIAVSLKQLGIKRFMVSLPCGVENINNMITQNSKSYEQTIRGIKILLKNDIPFTVNMVISKLNISYIHETAFVLKSLGVADFSVTKAATPGNCLDFSKYKLSNNEFNRMLNDTLEVRDGLGMKVYTSEFYPLCSYNSQDMLDTFGKGMCSAGKTSVVIGFNGGIRPCQHSTQVYGDISESILDAWGNMDAWRDNSLHPALCKNCKMLDICCGGCKVEALMQYGDSAYSGTSGRRFRKHPDTKPEASGHFAG